MTQPDRKVQRLLRTMTLTVEGGEVELRYPDPMDAADVEDTKQAIAIWLRGIERRAITP